MKEIKCPNCGKSFAIDESDYAELLSHIRTDEFEKELKSREQALVEKYNSQNKLEVTTALSLKEKEISNLKLEYSKTLSDKDKEIERLKVEKETT